jgi:DnaJ-domain-containing protein 1
VHLPGKKRPKRTRKNQKVDKNFLTFLGNFFLRAAEGRRQLEDMTRWMDQGASSLDEMTNMFRKFYGLEGLPSDSPEYAKAWHRASESFTNSLNDWLASMSVVPRRDYLELEKKYAALKKEVVAQDETIRQYRNLLKEKGIPQPDMVQSFAKMMEKQARQFQQLMESAGRMYKRDAD